MDAFTEDYDESYYDDTNGIITSSSWLGDFVHARSEVQVVLHVFIDDKKFFVPLSDDPIESAQAIELKNS